MTIRPEILERMRAGKIKESPATLSLVAALSSLPAGMLWTYGHWVQIAGAGGALAAAKLRHRLYDEAADLIPLHRIMSTKDFYGRIDGPVPQGEHGRVFKIALREIEGALAHLPSKKGRSALPSRCGLPASKVNPKDMPSGTLPVWAEEVSFTECDKMKTKIINFIASGQCTVETAWKYGAEILAAEKAAANAGGGGGAIAKRKVISDTMSGGSSKKKLKMAKKQ